MTIFHLLFYFILSSFTTDVGTVHLSVSNIQTPKGAIMVAVFNAESSFLIDGEAYRTRAVPIKETGSMAIAFEDMPYGTYSVAIYHDVNDNEELDTNLFGVPKEPYGFSNNARSKWGPPEYTIAKFELTKSVLKMDIQVKKWSKQ